jgi:hypothetical protein
MSIDIPGHEIELGRNHKVGAARMPDGGVIVKWLNMDGEAVIETKVRLSKEGADATWIVIRRALGDAAPRDVEIEAKEVAP